MPTITDLARYC
ncbi:hypothetical protein F383_16885 [Gossypium arboreum]|uniref:Uncharacterized protein n=1 Tax=Gossypium arboreum TaxID=29729 RepID=A0A0B0NML7_GOSAR|nr:hypothetical protein F383_16885 [Gossypium arboreum]